MGGANSCVATALVSVLECTLNSAQVSGPVVTIDSALISRGQRMLGPLRKRAALEVLTAAEHGGVGDVLDAAIRRARAFKVDRGRLVRAEARLAAVRAQEASRAAIMDRLERATTTHELCTALELVGTDVRDFATEQLDEHRERLGDLIATLIDDADFDVPKLREAVRAAVAAEPQVAGKSAAFEAALRAARATLAEEEAEAVRRAERLAEGAHDMLPEMPNEFRCAITLEPMRDPVTAADGHTYERAAIERHLADSRRSPITNEELPHTRLMASYTIKKLIREWPEKEHERIMRTIQRVRQQLRNEHQQLLSAAMRSANQSQATANANPPPATPPEATPDCGSAETIHSHGRADTRKARRSSGAVSGSAVASVDGGPIVGLQRGAQKRSLPSAAVSECRSTRSRGSGPTGRNFVPERA